MVNSILPNPNFIDPNPISGVDTPEVDETADDGEAFIDEDAEEEGGEDKFIEI